MNYFTPHNIPNLTSFDNTILVTTTTDIFNRIANNSVNKETKEYYIKLIKLIDIGFGELPTQLKEKIYKKLIDEKTTLDEISQIWNLVDNWEQLDDLYLDSLEITNDELRNLFNCNIYIQDILEENEIYEYENILSNAKESVDIYKDESQHWYLLQDLEKIDSQFVKIDGYLRAEECKKEEIIEIVKEYLAEKSLDNLLDFYVDFDNKKEEIDEAFNFLNNQDLIDQNCGWGTNEGKKCKI
ncbi:Hypothetical protein MALK_6580 [Metamycoplasma alkalescens 14918]|uniref:Uncharacterized protein n=1 Tax=Metamycoplasma alkalescens 14918 TaxID=1188234 RepID=N9SQ72_9BACT|nr:hypothetical protein [Metamycoplasma alkalescens]ENY53630.1 Hypothetical protein MALK_6580 [Metamycoplasma alkalescens 14918]